jgi:methyl-accepting chemotaxis protein
MAFLGRLSLKYRLHLSNILFLILLIVVIAMYFRSDATIEKLVLDQQSLANSANRIRNTALMVKDYLAGEDAFENISREFKGLSQDLKGGSLAGEIETLGQNIGEFNKLRSENDAVALEIDALTTESVKKSNGYIEMVSQKLASETDRSKVSTLERLVIIGANINTTANYEIKVRFMKLRESLANKDSLLSFLETLTANVEQDVKRPADTPFAQMAVAAKKANLRVKELTLVYIDNVG